MPAYFASDVHLRLDCPDRGLRFADWVSGLSLSDTLVIAGDLCDFWFASRQQGRGDNSLRCPGLKALAERASQGGSVRIMVGNHDPWLGPFYEEVLGAQLVAEPLELEVHNLRVHLVHGHLLGGRSYWKAVMESRAFLRGFGTAPGFLARGLEDLLKQVNDRGRAASDRRHLALYRHYADQLEGRADLAVFGHIHRPHDDTSRPVRMIVLGSWIRGSSYLMIDDQGATLVSQDGTD
ncbi:MAG TPA: UDP-2,3-diacylglucosamine diphosphatase [Isosphaeraceae bacterium]|nr:UDP-2,3-diacylglucosamine diphosphatase [Isosphaeraceae bacterium]